MNLFEKEYAKKLRNIDYVLEQIQDGDFIATSGGGCTPDAFFKNLHTIAPRIKNRVGVYYGSSAPAGTYEFLEKEEYFKKFHTITGFILGPGPRDAIKRGALEFFPTHYHNQGSKIVETRGVDVYVAAVCPMDERTGYFRTSFGNVNEIDFRNAAKKIILEVVPSMPVIYGNNEIHISEVDAIYEADHPIETLDPQPFGEIEAKIGEYVATLVEDGSTIQLGIGAIPDAVAHAFMNKKNLGVHTEMITNSILDLVKAGVITGKEKSLDRGVIVGAFSLGSKELYEFMDKNPQVSMKNCSYVNDPNVIAQCHKMVSINTCMGIDLTGQVSSESIGTLQYSGTGGQVDTVTGSIHAAGGKSIMALCSTAKKGTVSKISAVFEPGTAITLSRNDLDYVVTEYGIAHLRGTTIPERAKRLISIAHPKFRDELTAKAKEFGYIV